MSRTSLPAEWQKNRAVWLAWPSLADAWLEDLEPARAAVAEMARAIAQIDPATGEPRGERIEMLVMDDQGEDDARRQLGDTPVRFHRIPFGDIWLRDTGPIFTIREGALVAACFRWNGWGEKYLFDADVAVAERITAAAGAVVERHDFILEGGSVDWDGEGTVLTTRQCLLAENRAWQGQRADEREVERRLADVLGLGRVIWLDEGLLEDHTDGHVDTLARFVAPGRVVCMRAHDADDPNRAVLEQIARDLRAARDVRDRPLEVIEIPSPGRILDRHGRLMPASYVNFYLGNAAVVVPTYGSDHDQEAVDQIARLFPGRRVVGVDARAVLTGGGAFHCISKQEPALG